MEKIKIIHFTGLGLFIAAFILFLGTFFVGYYNISKDELVETIKHDEAQDFVTANFADAIEQNHKLAFSFVESIKEGFEKSNDAIRVKYAIEKNKANDFSRNASLDSFNPTVFNDFFTKKNEVDRWKLKQLTEYTSWMEGKSYESADLLAEQLVETIEKINESIIAQKGFQNSDIKKYSFELSRKAYKGSINRYPLLWLFLTVGLATIGGMLYYLPRLKMEHAGIKNDGIFHKSISNRGVLGIAFGIFLISFYIILYWFPEYMYNWIQLTDPISLMISGNPASQWFLYGFLYTAVILVMGVRMLIKYRHSPYQKIRTASVMFFQLSFAFLIPEILVRLNLPYMDLKNIWPLNYTFFFDYRLDEMISAGTIGMFMLVWGIILFIIIVPVFTYIYGKRWYCSWVCGCGGLAETLGDPYRQLSDKSLKAWQVERYLIHGVLVFAVVMTIGVLYTYFSGSSSFLGINTYTLRSTYGFAIGSVFAGVVGTGFYPFMGNRVWCRFGCPLAAYLGIVQRFKSRFRITTNGGQCISCGNCSTYCEMGIDVRWYAQRGQNIVRSSCVGCGVCSSVCPRGVLNLENRDENGRLNQAELLGNDSFN